MVKIRKVSKKQEALNNEMNKIKRELPDRCCICGRPAVDPAHLLPRSMYPEYYTAKWNVVPMCREHHRLYDNDIEFRKQQKKLYKIVLEHDEYAAHRYFKSYEYIKGYEDKTTTEVALPVETIMNTINKYRKE